VVAAQPAHAAGGGSEHAGPAADVNPQPLSIVDVLVSRLREKIETDPTRPRRIATIWGTGYRYDPGVPAHQDG